MGRQGGWYYSIEGAIGSMSLPFREIVEFLPYKLHDVLCMTILKHVLNASSSQKSTMVQLRLGVKFPGGL